MKSMLKFWLCLAAFSALTFTACKKDDETNDAVITENAVIASEDLSEVESVTQSVEDDLDETLEENGIKTRGTCPAVAFSAPKGTFPQTVTLTFDGTCRDRHSRSKTGQIIITLSDSLTKTGATKTVEYKNFMIDSAKVEGKRVWANKGKNAEGQPTFTRTAQNMKITFPDGTFATWSATHAVTKSKGSITKLPADDEWTVTGGSNGVNRKGKTFSSEITTPIVHRWTCPWIISGVRTVKIDDKTRSLDYGYDQNKCDREAELTLANGEKKIIKIRR